MSTYIHLVFSDPPPGVSDAEFDAWYDAHLSEILSVEGWESAQRYRLDPVVNPSETGGYRFLSVYHLSVPPAQAVANLETAGFGDADSYVDKKDEEGAGPLPLPDWFTGVRFGSWNCSPIGSLVGKPH